MTDRQRCRARPEPVLAIEMFVRDHPGVFSPREVEQALSGIVDPATIAAVVTYLLGTGGLFLDDEGCLVRPE
jgi:hypothetical protein